MITMPLTASILTLLQLIALPEAQPSI